MRVVIVEDDESDEKLLVSQLRRFDRERGVGLHVEWCCSTLDFLEREEAGDVVFMDIQMPGINGMEAAQIMRTRDEATPLIFVTNLAQYAVKGYEVDALGFVIKPVTYPDVALQMSRAVRVAGRNSRRAVNIQTKDGVRIFFTSDLVFTEVRNHDLTHHVMGDAGMDALETRGALSAFLRDYSGQAFLQISSSTVVNMDHIRSVRRDCLVMDSGDTLYFSRARRKESLEAISRYLDEAPTASRGKGGAR